MTDDTAAQERPSKTWWLQYAWGKICHLFVRKCRGVATHWTITIILPWITGSYYAILDVWGEDWDWVKDHIAIHERVFIGCLAVSLLSQFLGKVIPGPQNLESDQDARQIMSEFIGTVGAIVQAKLERFRSKLGDIRHHSDKFKHITKPGEQVSIIAMLTSRFLQSVYGLQEDQVDITILKRRGGGGWAYMFKLQSWAHSDPNDLMGKSSAAVRSLERCEPIFLADKVKAASNNLFFLSDRDKRRKCGSAYIYPVSLVAEGTSVQYVVSIVTYAKQFCADYDIASCEATEAFLREICRRLEIELCLDTIRIV